MLKRIIISITCVNMTIRHLRRRAISIRVEYHHRVPHRLCGGDEHAAKLTAAQNAQGSAGENHVISGSFIFFTASDCAARNDCKRRAIFLSFKANSAAANKAALVAPASPMAKVATGTPFGICTIDNKESSPCKCLDGTGTPNMGTVVLAASMPGK